MTNSTPAQEVMELLIDNVKKLLGQRMIEGEMITAAEISSITRLCSDSSVTMASVKRGDFGDLAQQAAEQFPFDPEDEGRTYQ